MLTPEDIKNLTEYQKEIFATKEDITDLKGLFSTLQTSVDGIAKDNLTKNQETIGLRHRMKNAEDWIDKASPKLDLEFKH